MPEARKRRIIQEDEVDEEETYAPPQKQSRKTESGSRPARNKAKAVKVQESEDELDHTIGEDDEEENEEYRDEPEGWDTVPEPAEDDDELFNEQAEKELKKAKAHSGKIGMTAEIGVIEMIEMFDFMCHRHLKVPFGPKINFIIGHNGSGKSAIMTAITVCLGGKANSTNRAQTLKALIREGASQAEVKLQIRNQGPDAYKPHIYGESIIIERRISKDGTSGYKVRSSKGKTISTKREELAAMCDHMNIQVDNPMNMLSQDAARQFLQSSTPEDKYRFFSRGTHLSQLSGDYEIVRECIETMQVTLKSKNEDLAELLELAKASQARFKDSQQAAALELKVDELKNQVAWAQIEELESGVKETEEQYEARQAKIPAIEAKRAQELTKMAEMDEKIEKLERIANEHVGSTAPTQERKRQLENELREKRDELKNVQDEERTVNDEIKNAKDLIRGYDQKIEHELKKMQGSAQSRRSEIEDNIRQLEQQVEGWKRQLAEGREDASKYEQQADEGRNRLEQHSNTVNKTKAELNDTKTRIRQLRDQKDNALKAFGPSIPDVLRDIEQVTNKGGWRGEQPVGPLGRHVKLRDQTWVSVIESALGGVLNAFAVTTDADRSTLFGILKRHRCNSDILLTKRVLFDYRSKEPSTQFLTINRVLDFDDEWVRRLMIDKLMIESTILVEKRAEADRITSSGRNGSFPDNVTQCFTLDLVRVGDRSGGAASIMMQHYRGPPRLSQNVDQQLEVLEGTALQLEDSLRYMIKESQQLLKQVEGDEGRRLQAKRQATVWEKDIKLKTRTVEDLRNKLQADEPSNLAAYEESKQQALEEIENWKKQYAPIAQNKQRINVAMEPLRQQITELNNSIKDQESGSMKIRAELDTLNMKRQEIMPRIQHWESKLKQEKATVKELELDLQVRTKYLEESTAKATEYCERVEVTATLAQLQREIKQIQERLREQEAQRGCSLEEIAIDMTRRQDDYNSAKLAIREMHNFINKLKRTLHIRMTRWREFRQQMALRSRISFSLQLSKRGYSGSLTFDHPTKQLNIRVETEDARSNAAGAARDKDPKSLSGGEKSFSTICLLLALWDSMSSSIRCLDEFDVFMDAVNRRISMQMLIGTAREADGVQYILITPQDASSVSPGPDVRVHRLHDPERNQQTLQ
ncbi:Structural maintenance of chromosomes protein 6 [Mortierella alpina]|uniref:Structural maintenance of chromosomes protein 6 n=1 Tax=Mortierella alpina TaxID=64518 RepID=A0A9P6JFA7_MORAP|nr:Structural maintenance of chromosomes protein 6 [Mortierella alpina]